MESIVIIIIGIVFALLSAFSKKKQNKSTENEPPRPTLSDIQRAFMMSGEMEANKRAPETRPISSFGQPAARPAPPVQPEMKPRVTQSVSSFQAPNRYANIDLAAFPASTDDVKETPKNVARQPKSSFKLFEDKSDFVRAVIYSEILTRKTHR